jgi:NADH-quinone oxidoreductase subunit G
MKALGGAQVVAFSHFACQSTRAIADVILPIGALPEIDATLINLDGRDQVAVPAGKLPGEARPGWRVLRALGGQLGLPGFEFTDLVGLRASLAGNQKAVIPSEARNLLLRNETRQQIPRDARDDSVEGGLELAVSQAIYRIDSVTRRAQALQSHPLTLGPRITLHPDDARAIGVSSDAMAKVFNTIGTATLQVATSDRVALGAAWIESGYGATAALGAGRVKVTAA